MKKFTDSLASESRVQSAASRNKRRKSRCRGVAVSYVARASIGAGKPLQSLPLLWIQGHPVALPLSAEHRGVRVRALYREDQIFAEPEGSNVDSAIELLAHLQNCSPSTAIAGGWTAIESLLGESRRQPETARQLQIAWHTWSPAHIRAPNSSIFLTSRTRWSSALPRHGPISP